MITTTEKQENLFAHTFQGKYGRSALISGADVVRVVLMVDKAKVPSDEIDEGRMGPLDFGAHAVSLDHIVLVGRLPGVRHFR